MAALERSKSRANSFPRCLTPHAESPFCISLADPDLRKLSSDTVSAVGGIENALGDDGYRKDLNHPPTAVGGIR